MSNPLRERLNAGKVSAGILTAIPSMAEAQALAWLRFDWMLIDMEHGPIGIETCHQMITASSGTGCAPVVRVMEPNISYTKPVLDAGAMGIVFPMINSAALAEQAVQAVRYPPRGKRGWGPFFAPMRWGENGTQPYARAAGDIVIIALIEHKDAVEQIDEILAVDGIDVYFIAPLDMAVSLGHAGDDRDHADVQAAILRAEEAILAAGKPLGTLCLSAKEGNEKIARGYTVLLMGTDLLLLGRGANAMLNGLKR